jgi:hypothetical protein
LLVRVAVGYTFGTYVFVGEGRTGATDVDVTDGRMITVNVSVGVSVSVIISTIVNSGVFVTSTVGDDAAAGKSVGVRVANIGRNGVWEGGRKALISSTAS